MYSLEKRRVDDYLDLYLYAKSMGDVLWQEEILLALRQSEIKAEEEKMTSNSENLLKQYKKVNDDILQYYHQMQTFSPSANSENRLRLLKEQRLALGRRIKMLNKQTDCSENSERQ
ncbi:hypothetical protein [Bacillus sp. 03113]|uniref:hypothetical protein n=1 Tax=Bacillus sp. 03113 TaxID=2578211 RepID=UPI001144BFA1|nr:hypothetical protein [Bacillus sp. 03113]